MQPEAVKALASAIHAPGRAIAGIDALQAPATPKTSLTVGTVSGGTSVNAIAAEATSSSIRRMRIPVR